MPDTKPDSALTKLAPTLLSIALGAISAWGTSQYISGQREERLRTLEYQVKQLEIQKDQYMTRQEMKSFTDNASESLRQIREDIRDLRNQRR